MPLGHSVPRVAALVALPDAGIDVGIGGGVFAGDTDIGSPAQAGSLSYSNGTYTISGGGSDIGGNSDQFNFAYNAWAGDGSIIARITSLTNTNAAAKAGLMFRSGVGAAAAFAGIFVTPTSGITFIVRGDDGGTAGQTTTLGVQAPRFLKLTRAAGQVSGYYSTDALSWIQLGSTQTANLGTSAQVGLAVTSRNLSTVTTAVFTNVSLLLPSGWNDNDVGSPALPGSAAYDPGNNTFVINSSGVDIGSNSDQFNFAGHSLTGDGSVIARIDGQSAADPLAKAGIMIRNDMTSGAIFASVVVTVGNNLLFQWRAATGAAAASATLTGPGGSVWLKLTQQGNRFNAYYSTDAIIWSPIGASQSIAMSSATTQAGLAATSHNNSSLNAATFSSVSLLQSGWTDQDIGSPALSGSATYDAPSNTYTLIGGGADTAATLRRSIRSRKLPRQLESSTSDQFNFLRRNLTGNGSVIAYVNSMSNTDPWAKAGVMLRVDTSAASAFAGLHVTPQNGVVFEWRAATGGQSQQIVSAPPGGLVAAPVSLKLSRTGNSFAAYYSTDGINWSLIGSPQTLTLPSTVLAGIAVSAHNAAAVCTASFTGVSVGTSPPPGSGVYSAEDELFLNDLEYRHVQFFYNETNPNTGLVPDGALASGGSNGSSCSIASLGFGLTALTIADQRGWLSHAAAYQRALTTVNFLYNSGASVNGFFYHFLNPTTGQRVGTSELSPIDTAELMAGVLNVGQYWAGTPVQTMANNLYNRVNWPWMQKANGQFYGQWTPEGGFAFGYSDFSEAVVLYLLGLGSPTHPSTQASWYSWSRTPVVNYAGMTFVTAGTKALFTVQYPQGWYDMRGLIDNTGLNYYLNAQTATLAQRQWMTDISSTYPDYGPNMWGLTASDSANGYAVWGGPPAFGPIDGTVVPTGPGGSLAFTPRVAIDALKYMRQTFGSTVYRKYGFIDAFNPLTSWNSSIVLGIDAGMTLLAAENSRSNFVWNAFDQSPIAGQSLAEAFPTARDNAWMVRGSGNWNSTASWSRGVVPNGVGAKVDFLGAIPAARTVFTDVPITAASLEFNNTSSYVVSGAGTLTLQSAGGNAEIIVHQGTHTINLPTLIASNTVFNIAGGATLIIADPMTVNPGLTITQTGGGAVIYQSTINYLGGAGTVVSNPTSSVLFAVGNFTTDLNEDEPADGAGAGLNGVELKQYQAMPKSFVIPVNHRT